MTSPESPHKKGTDGRQELHRPDVQKDDDQQRQ